MRIFFLLAIPLAITVAHATDNQDNNDAPDVNPLASSGDFLSYHPGLGDRRMGMQACKDGNYDGDAVAKPGLAIVMRRGLRDVTRSHTGLVGTMRIQIPGFSIDPTYIDANQNYDPRLWKERDYWVWADKAWKAPPHGTVNMGNPESMHTSKPANGQAPPDDGTSDSKTPGDSGR